MDGVIDDDADEDAADAAAAAWPLCRFRRFRLAIGLNVDDAAAAAEVCLLSSR